MTFRKYLVLAGVTVFSTAGDSLLARGMKELGERLAAQSFQSDPRHPQSLGGVRNPAAAGILLLPTCPRSRGPTSPTCCPATSLGYVLVALIAHFSFHEDISPTRWLGIALIAAGVGFVAAGPSVTPAARQNRRTHPAKPFPREVQVVKEVYAWAAIGLIILASTTGDVLLSYSMKRVGDVGELWKRTGCWR